MKTELVQFRATPELKDTLRKLAADNCRTMSQQIEYLILKEERNAKETAALR